MPVPPSLRDLYVDPASAWAFNVPAAPSHPPASPPPPSYHWSARSPPNSIFDLSPSLDFAEPSTIDAGRLAKTIVASAILQYTSTAIVNPWEVGKLLLQVQWVPRDAGEPDVEEYDNDDAVRLATIFLQASCPTTCFVAQRRLQRGHIFCRPSCYPYSQTSSTEANR